MAGDDAGVGVESAVLALVAGEVDHCDEVVKAGEHDVEDEDATSECEGR